MRRMWRLPFGERWFLDIPALSSSPGDAPTQEESCLAEGNARERTMKFIEHRVANRRILRLIQKWLKAGVSEDGQWSETMLGTPQGAVDCLNAKDNFEFE